MTSSTDHSPPPSPRSSRHPSVALPCHPHVARPGNTAWRGLASLAGWKHHTVHRGKRHEYEWVTDLPLNGSPDSPRINFIQFRIVKNGKVTYRNAWVTDLVPTTDNIVQLVRAARARWKIENEAFNTLKNQGYHLKHNFGHGDRHLSEAFFTLNLLAFFMHQIFELVDGLYQRVRTFFSSRRAFWDEVRSAFRLFLFTSWDQVLERMNSPPEQLPPYGSR